ncbi:hypothetical protein CJ030_MR6G010788 [Morella rubra]|uniref:Secreted protein n=1 Tax=Morella rubra TaxID=262757 RepID=A0A6A1VCA8_9ROSI|nr:hypothetical protein CJ030_MR6G010788 [Morella rubra]
MKSLSVELLLACSAVGAGGRTAFSYRRTRQSNQTRLPFPIFRSCSAALSLMVEVEDKPEFDMTNTLVKDLFNSGKKQL